MNSFAAKASAKTADAIERHFSPYGELAGRLLGGLDLSDHDPAHDVGHLMRVWRAAWDIVEADALDVDGELLLAAAVLHDCVHVDKNDPRRSQASRLAAERAGEVVAPLGWDRGRVDALAHAIEAHSFSAGIEPTTIEAKVLQDADRLDSLGAIGVARCFMVSGRIGRPLYDVDDPAAARRSADDLAFTLDHFPVKLLRLAGTFRTDAGRGEAGRRTAGMAAFLDDLMGEIEPVRNRFQGPSARSFTR